MRLIHNNNLSDPRMNLALEEYCLRNLETTDEYVLFYVNEPSVIIGRHQNPFEEGHVAYLRKRGIQLVRRISGGGAVYHDAGNLNFSFITDFGEQKLDYFKKLIQPILRALQRLGVPAEITKKNNIVVDGKKVSGNSQYTNINRMLSHGTLLFDSDLIALNSALKSNSPVLQSKAIQSVRSEVVNIADYTKRSVDLNALRGNLMTAICDQFGELKHLRLSGDDWNAIYKLAENQYKSWDWTFGRSPDFVVGHNIELRSVQVECRLHIARGRIKEITTRDKTLASSVIDDLKSKYLGRKYDAELG